MEYTIDKDFKVILKQGTKVIDIVGAFESAESGQIWADAVCAKYNDNPTFVYPGEEPEEITE